MLAAALQQRRHVVHTALSVHSLTFPSVLAGLASPQRLDRCASSHRYSLSPTNSDREYGILDQEQHRRISSPSQTDPPSVFF
jgi:hypothetical protein